jgi:hypothetical protein
MALDIALESILTQAKWVEVGHYPYQRFFKRICPTINYWQRSTGDIEKWFDNWESRQNAGNINEPFWWRLLRKATDMVYIGRGA